MPTGEKGPMASYAEWHVAVTEGAAGETMAGYALVYGDYRRLHRSDLIACHFPHRAAEVSGTSAIQTGRSAAGYLFAHDAHGGLDGYTA